jgi:hypothetical protein
VAESSVIREFLVGLGFKVDEPALKRFSDGIAIATKTVFSLAAAIEGTVAIVAAGVARYASNLEQLYFASVRTGTSVANLKALGRAAQNFGASQEEAEQSVEGFAHSLRENPGLEAYLNGLGIATRDAKGKARDLTEVFLDLGHFLARQPMYMAERYASMFGISEHMMLAMRQPGFDAEFRRRQREYQSAGADRVARQAHVFMEQLRDLETALEGFAFQLQDVLERKFGVSIASITRLLRLHGREWARAIANAIAEILDWTNRAIAKLEQIWGWYKRLDAATDGWATKIAAAAIALKMLGGFEVIGALASVTLAVSKLGAGLLGLVGRAGLLATRLVGLGGLAEAIGGGALAATGIGAGIAALGVGGYFAWEKLIGPWLQKKTAELTGNPNESLFGWMRGLFDRGDKAIDFLMSKGWSREQAAGIAANIDQESHFNAGAVGDNGKAYGLAQWHQPFWNLFFQRYHKAMNQASFEEQLDFLNLDLTQGPDSTIGKLLRAQSNAGDAARLFALKYERPSASAEQAEIRAREAVAISQKTDIHVNGVDDPKATAREVANAQHRVNQNLTRNAIGRVK